MYKKPESPLEIGAILDDGFRLFKESFSRLILLAVVGSLIGQIPALVLSFGRTGEALRTSFTMLEVVIILASMAASFLVYACLVVRLDGISNNRDLSLSQTFSVGLSRFIPFLLCSILYSVCIVIGAVALIVPGIILSVSLLFAPYATITDSLGPVKALGYSRKLVKGNWWRTSGILTVAVLIFISASLLVAFLSGFSAFTAQQNAEANAPSLVIIFVLTPAINAIILPLFYALILAVFNDLKLRREGLDLEDKIAAIEPE